MDATLKQKWVEALRGGAFKQARHNLCDSSGAQCCLGVLATVMGCEWRFGDPYLKGESIRHLSGEWLAVRACGINYDLQSALSRQNDEGESFSEIADYIEQNIPAESAL